MDDEENGDGAAIFRQHLKRAFEDGIITADERAELEKLRVRLQISEQAARAIFQEEKSAAVLQNAKSPFISTDTQRAANLLHLAATASDSGNHQEAYEFCNKVLEIDSRNHHAWFGKAKSAGWSSTLANFRLPEMISGIQRAVEYAPTAERGGVVTTAAELLREVIVAYYQTARSHLMQYAALDDSWNEYLSHCNVMIQGLIAAYEFDPDPRIAHDIICICTDNIEGIRYETFEGYTDTRHVSGEYESHLRSIIEKYETELKRYDRSYTPPRIQKVSSCFVVTAVMGDPIHPDVLALRRFRDQTLRRHNLGIVAIRGYSVVGPILAELISRSTWLRRLAAVILVRPAALIVSRICPATPSFNTGFEIPLKSRDLRN